VRVDRFFVDLRAGDRLVLCTDGLSNYVSGAEIGEFASNYDAEDLPLGLIACANERGGGDNCTVVTVSVPAGGQPQFDGAPTRPDKLRSVRFLESIDLFSELDFQELITAAQFITGQVARVDDKVIAREDAVDGMYVVMSGVLAVEIDGMELNRVEAGDHFGEFALFGSPLRSADVRCLEDAKLLHISSENLERLVVAYPEIGNKILRALLSRTSKIIQDMLAAEEGAS
jgi:CRP-like cAMP-binding protein